MKRFGGNLVYTIILNFIIIIQASKTYPNKGDTIEIKLNQANNLVKIYIINVADIITPGMFSQTNTLNTCNLDSNFLENSIGTITNSNDGPDSNQNQSFVHTKHEANSISDKKVDDHDVENQTNEVSGTDINNGKNLKNALKTSFSIENHNVRMPETLFIIKKDFKNTIYTAAAYNKNVVKIKAENPRLDEELFAIWNPFLPNINVSNISVANIPSLNVGIINTENCQLINKLEKLKHTTIRILTNQNMISVNEKNKITYLDRMDKIFTSISKCFCNFFLSFGLFFKILNEQLHSFELEKREFNTSFSTEDRNIFLNALLGDFKNFNNPEFYLATPNFKSTVEYILIHEDKKHYGIDLFTISSLYYVLKIFNEIEIQSIFPENYFRIRCFYELELSNFLLMFTAFFTGLENFTNYYKHSYTIFPIMKYTILGFKNNRDIHSWYIKYRFLNSIYSILLTILDGNENEKIMMGMVLNVFLPQNDVVLLSRCEEAKIYTLYAIFRRLKITKAALDSNLTYKNSIISFFKNSITLKKANKKLAITYKELFAKIKKQIHLTSRIAIGFTSEKSVYEQYSNYLEIEGCETCLKNNKSKKRTNDSSTSDEQDMVDVSSKKKIKQSNLHDNIINDKNFEIGDKEYKIVEEEMKIIINLYLKIILNKNK